MTHLRGSRMAYRQLRFDRPLLAVSRIADALRSAWPVLVIFLCLLIAGGIDAGTLP